MFERYNETARRSLFFSRYEAALLAGRAIETEHLLLGVLKDRDTLIAHLLGGSHSLDAIRQRLYERAGTPGPPIDVSVEIPFSADTKLALQYAAEEGSRLLHAHIGPEHLLLGLLSLERGLAVEILNEKGFTLPSVREALVRHVSATSPPPAEIAEMLAAMRGLQREPVPGPIYVLTVVDGPSPGRRPAARDAGSGHFAAFSTAGFSTLADRPPDGGVHSIGPISMAGTTLSAFTLLLESFLNRPVLDETGITSACDITLQGEYDSVETLTAALRDQLGLELISSLT
jgi:hypothetical protein